MRSSNLHSTKEGMCLKLRDFNIHIELVLNGCVVSVQRHGLVLQITACWSVNKLVLCQLLGISLQLIVIAVAIAEV